MATLGLRASGFGPGKNVGLLREEPARHLAVRLSPQPDTLP